MPVAPPVPPSPAARRIALPRWLDLRLAVGVTLVLVSVLVGAQVVATARRTYPRVITRRELSAGTVLTADDVTLAAVQLPGRGAGVYLDRVDAAVGKVLSRPVSAGELLPAAALAAEPQQTTVTVPLPAGAAPELRKGQRIELWVSTSACASAVLLPDVVVQTAQQDSAGSFSDTAAAQDVVINVAPQLADRVIQALALDQVQLRAGVLSGPARPATALPDLEHCTAATR